MSPPVPPRPPRSRSELTRAWAINGGILAAIMAACVAVIWFIYTFKVLVVTVAVAALVVWGARRVFREVVRQQQAALEAEIRRRAHLEGVDVMTGPQFEAFIADLLRRDGWRDVRIVGRSGDKGVDVTARAVDGRRFAFQCKRQAKPVTADRVRNLIGAVHSGYRGHVGVLVTSNRYTGPAVDEATGQIMLIDRRSLLAWMDGSPLSL